MITASSLNLTTNNASSFANKTAVTGATSGATATVLVNEGPAPEARTSTGNRLLVVNVSGTFVAGETISNGTVSATLDANPITLGIYDNKYVTLAYGNSGQVNPPIALDV